MNAFFVDNQTHGKQSFSLEDWDYMQFLNPRLKPTYDASGQLLWFEEWENPKGAYAGREVLTASRFYIEIAPMTEDEQELFVQFTVRDIYGNLWNSELMSLQ